MAVVVTGLVIHKTYIQEESVEMMGLKQIPWLLAASMYLALNVTAAELTVPNQFSAGDRAVASEVNDNFTAVKTAVDDNNTNISALQSTITTLQKENAAQDELIVRLEAEIDAAVDALAGKLSSAVVYPIFPRSVERNTSDYSISSGSLVATVQFNLPVDITTFSTENIRISGVGLGVETVSLTWSEGNTTLIFTSDSTSASSVITGSCGELEFVIEGDGENSAKDLQGKPIDGDRDGVPGGDLVVIYAPRACI